MCDSVSFCLPEAATQLSVESCAFCICNFIITCRGFDLHRMITTDPTQFQMLAVRNGDRFGRLNLETAKSRQTIITIIGVYAALEMKYLQHFGKA